MIGFKNVLHTFFIRLRETKNRLTEFSRSIVQRATRAEEKTLWGEIYDINMHVAGGRMFFYRSFNGEDERNFENAITSRLSASAILTKAMNDMFNQWQSVCRPNQTKHEKSSNRSDESKEQGQKGKNFLLANCEQAKLMKNHGKQLGTSCCWPFIFAEKAFHETSDPRRCQ